MSFAELRLDVNAYLTGTGDLMQSSANLLRKYTSDNRDPACLVWSDTRTLINGGSETLSLGNGTLRDALNNPANFATVSGLVIHAYPGNYERLLVGGAPSAAFDDWFGDPTDKVSLRPGSTLALMAGADRYTAARFTDENLRIEHLTTVNGTAGQVTYDIIIFGTST